jgi:NodT family efflux transporter outer membrane factor (OMF) lipoprotein
VALISLLLSACTVGPTYRAPVPSAIEPKAFENIVPGVTTASPLDAWWRGFQDPTLDSLVDLALHDNPQLAAAEATVRRSREGVVQARGAGLPALNAAARASDDKLSRNGENLALIPFTPSRTEFTDYRVGLDASWEIDLAGRTRREVEAAVARFGSASETRNDARVVIAAEVATAYADFRGAARRFQIAAARDSSAQQSLRLIKLQRDAGVIGDVEYLQAVVEQRTAAAAAAAASAAVEPAIFSLVALTGESAKALRSRLGASTTLLAPPADVPVGLPADLLRRRPDVRHAERELAAATADVGAAIAAQFPRLSLVGAAGLDSIRSGDLTSAASRYWTIAPQLTLPLVAGGRLRSGVRAAQANLDAAVATYRGTVLRAVADAESSIVRYGAALTRLSAFGAAADARESNLAAIRQRQEAGDASMVDLLAAERAADDATEQRTLAAVEVAARYIALNKALGGGWQQP